MAKVTETVSSPDCRPLPALLAGPGSQAAGLPCGGALRTQGPGRTVEPSSPGLTLRHPQHPWAALPSQYVTQASSPPQVQDALRAHCGPLH